MNVNNIKAKRVYKIRKALIEKYYQQCHIRRNLYVHQVNRLNKLEDIYVLGNGRLSSKPKKINLQRYT